MPESDITCSRDGEGVNVHSISTQEAFINSAPSFIVKKDCVVLKADGIQ